VVTPVLEMDDKSRMLLKDYQEIVSGQVALDKNAHLKMIQHKLNHDEQLQRIQDNLKGE
jgi:hypothetical protein